MTHTEIVNKMIDIRENVESFKHDLFLDKKFELSEDMYELSGLIEKIINRNYGA